MTTDKQQTELFKIFEDHNSNSKNTLEPEEITDLVDSITHLYEKNSYNGKVKQFHELFNQVINHSPTVPLKHIIMLRLQLILEELIELAEACGSEVLNEFQIMLYNHSENVRHEVEQRREHGHAPNEVEILDALCDLQYVLSGSIITFGMSKIIDVAFEEVHESNMTKLCKGDFETVKTIEHYEAKGEGCTAVAKGMTLINDKEEILSMIVRDSDGKVLKSINYKPTDLAQFIHN